MLNFSVCSSVQEGQGQFWWTVGPHAGDKYVGQFRGDQRHGLGEYQVYYITTLLDLSY